MIKKNWIIGITAMSCLSVGLNGLSAGESEAKFGMIYAFESQPKNEMALYEAIAEHAEWREKKGDPWNWDVYQEIVGEKLGTFHIGSWNHTLEEIDAYQEFLAMGHINWSANVMPHISDGTNVIMETDAKISHWPEGTSTNYVYVVDFTIKPGLMWQFKESVKAIHETIVAEDHPVVYSFSSVWAGVTGNIMSLAMPGATLADLDGPEENVYELMVRVHGEEKAGEVFANMNGAVETSRDFIVKRLPDISVTAAE